MIPLEKRKKQLSKAIGLDISEWKLDELYRPYQIMKHYRKGRKISI